MKAWIARDEDRRIFIYFKDKPEKFIDRSGKYVSYWENSEDMLLIQKEDLPEGINPQWSDEEPVEVELTINLKKGVN